MNVERRPLLDKVALITGAARGVGATIAAAFVRAGARVVLADLDEGVARQVAGSLGDAASALRLDVREELAWVAAMAQVLDAQGRFDVLVNNLNCGGCAAGQPAFDPEQTGPESWHAQHRHCCEAMLLGCKHGIRALRRSASAAGAGVIVNVAACHADAGTSIAPACPMCETAVREHTRSVAQHCVRNRLPIRCVAIRAATGRSRAPPPLIENGSGDRRHSLQVQTLAAVAVLLASDAARDISGVETCVDDCALLDGVRMMPMSDPRR